jgi:formylglycine-generating enzyme required for sulfatase activity
VSLEVPGGTYYRTYNTADSTSGPPDGGWTDEADPATVSGFRMDKYPVTVGRFRQFVNVWNNGAGYMPSAGSGIHTQLNGGLGLVNASAPPDAGTIYETGWNATDWNNTTDIDPTTANLTSCAPYSTWTASSGSQENLPINCVNWWEAYAFCIWDGGFLPSESEWEYVAAGGNQQREYPWGSTDPGTANQYAVYGSYYYDYASSIAPVGTATLGAAYWGQLDMAGEVFEWNLDGYAPYVDPCTNCAYLTRTAYRVIRGGGFEAFAQTLLSPGRHFYGGPPTGRDPNVGIRCARTP